MESSERVSRPERRQLRTTLAAVAFVLGFTGVAVVAERSLPILAVAENWASDWMVALFSPFSPQNPEIVVLALTEDTLSRFAFRSPVDRAFLARTLQTLGRYKARAVGIDMLFDQPTEPASDTAFRNAALSAPFPVVLGWTDRATNLTERQYAFQKRYLDGIRTGYVNLLKDASDGVVRNAFPGRADGGRWRPSFAGAIAGSLGLETPYESFPIDYRPGPDLATPAFRIYPIEALPNLPAQWLENRVVLIGADLPFEDRHRTVFSAQHGHETGSIPGVLIQAHILAQLMDGRRTQLRDHRIEAATILVLATIVLLIAWMERGVAFQALLGCAVVAALWGCAAFVYWRFGIKAPVVVPSLVFGAGLYAAVAYIGHLRRVEARFVREAFSRYVSPAVLKRIEQSPDRLGLGGEKREISVLFTDIEDFTRFAEKQEPTLLIGVLNRYLCALADVVQRFEGTVDKFVGDSVMAVFGSPDLQPDHAARAIQCAIHMRAVAARLTAELNDEGHAIGRTRIGIHSGLAVIGNIGGERRFDYTAIGDVVNTASRLEGANKYFGTDLCFSEDTRFLAHCADALPIGCLLVKGRTSALPVYTLADEQTGSAIDSYRAAYALMANNDSAAIAAFATHVERWPDDAVARFHFGRLRKNDVSDSILLEGK